MKNLNLTKVALSLIVGTQLISSNAFAKVKFEETILTTNRSVLADHRFKINRPTITEISDEEALEFVNASNNVKLHPKVLNLPIIPPRFPVANEGTPAVTPPAVTPSATPPTTPSAGPTPAPTGVFDGVIMIVDKLIAIGQKVIPTIEKGRAVVTNNPMAAISVLPRIDSKDAVVHEMSGWSYPVTKHYKIVYKNSLFEVASFVYSVTFQYGGSHDGKGKYLTGVRASAREIKVNMGFDLSAESQLIQISNVGTKDKIIAGATIEMAYTVKNFARTTTSYVSFFITGNGKLVRQD